MIAVYNIVLILRVCLKENVITNKPVSPLTCGF